MNNIVTKTLIAGVACVGVAGLASADTAPFDVVSGASHSGVNLSVTVQESSLAGYDFEFVINNNSTDNGAAITGIYFESGWADSLLSGSAFERNLNTSDVPGSGVNFFEGANSPDIAGWTDSLVSYEVGMTSVNMAAVWNGVDEGESATIAFAAGNADVTLEDLESALGASGFNIGVRLQDLFMSDNYVEGFALASFEGGGVLPPNGGGEDGEDDGATGVPTPTAAAAGLALLAFAGYRRRRDG